MSSNEPVVWVLFASSRPKRETAVREALTDILGVNGGSFIHRDYVFEEKLKKGQEKLTLLVFNGKTKTHLPDGESIGIYYDVRRVLRAHNCNAVIISHTFCNFYIDWLFRIKLRIYKMYRQYARGWGSGVHA